MIRGFQIVIRALCVLFVAGAASCGGPPKVEYDMARAPDRPMLGVASWYGPGFDGKQTASGERFNKGHLTAAHRSLPFGTVVRVKNLQNGRSVDVRINDRGPFVKGRIIDLSQAAARQIDLIQRGIGEVEVRVLSLPIQ
jgi:rare lipoprotein A